jgi:hypothetical protein
VPAIHAYEDFYASHDHTPGSERTLRVGGRVVFRSGGWGCRLRKTEGNTGINDRMLALDLVLDPPPEGAATTDALTPCEVEWSADDPPIEYAQVEFRLVGGEDDEPPPVLDVEHPQ